MAKKVIGMVKLQIPGGKGFHHDLVSAAPVKHPLLPGGYRCRRLLRQYQDHLPHRCRHTLYPVIGNSFKSLLRGAPGGHPDTAAGSKVCIIVTPLTRGRMATVCEKVVTVTTPGDCVDVLVTDYGIAVNPLRQDLIECLDNAGIPHVTIEELKEKAYSLVGRPDDLEWEDKVVAVLEARDGTILDVVRKIKPLEL